MPTEYQHKCIKCPNTYTDTDPEAYLCSACTEAKKNIAAQVDSKFANRPKRSHVSDLQAFDSQQKFKGFVVVKL